MSQPRTDKELMQQWLQPGAIVPVDTKTVRILLDALRERMAQPEQEPVACQYAKDVAMPEYRCAGKCLYAQPEQEPVAWEDVLGAIARGWTHDDNKHKTMDVQLAVAIAKEIQDMVIAPPQRKPPQFPTMLRKMWSGAEVQKWINEKWEQS